MTFVWAGMLTALILVPLLIGIYMWSQRRRQPQAARYSSLSLIHAAQPGSGRLRRHLPFALFVAALAALAVALARPTVVLSVPTNGTTVILAIDVSGSMCSTDIAPSRLEVAEDAASRFVLGQTTRTRIGLVAFSGFAAIVQAPTDDRDTLIEAIHSLTTGRRTAIGSGILTSIDAIAEIQPDVAPSIQAGRPGVAPAPVLPGEYAPAIIVVLTDGASNAGTDPLAAAQQAADRGVRVYPIGYGTERGGEMAAACRSQFIGREPGAGGGSFRGGGGGNFGAGGGGGRFRRGIDEDTLKQIATLTAGTYFPAESADELIGVFNALPTTQITAHEATEVSAAFVGIGALLCGLALLLGRAWRPLP